MVLPGFEVARVIPRDTIVGLITGQYKLYGGVIRWAAGTANAGQIVSHLLPSSLNPISTLVPGLDFIPGIVANVQLGQLKKMSKFNTRQLIEISGQLDSLSQATESIIQITNGTAFVSGLGLAVSCIGFATISNKLNKIDKQLKNIQQDVQDIKYFLESTERAKLHSAINELLKIDSHTSSENRHTILHYSRTTLGEINMRYRELLSEAKTLETAMTYEEYFVLTALAQARCTAELEMFDIASKEIKEMVLFWQNNLRRIAKEIFIAELPQRFLASDFAHHISITELSEWLDFIYEENKGLTWIDDLRIQMNESWYSENLIDKAKLKLFAKDKTRLFSNTTSGLNQNIGMGIDKETKMLIPSMRKLVARNGVLESYINQYEILESQQIKPHDFERKLMDVPESSLCNGCIILEPTRQEAITLA